MRPHIWAPSFKAATGPPHDPDQTGRVWSTNIKSYRETFDKYSTAHAFIARLGKTAATVRTDATGLFSDKPPSASGGGRNTIWAPTRSNHHGCIAKRLTILVRLHYKADLLLGVGLGVVPQRSRAGDQTFGAPEQPPIITCPKQTDALPPIPFPSITSRAWGGQNTTDDHLRP